MLNSEQLANLRLRIQKVFLPGRPISTYDLFSGRQAQMTKAIGAVLQPGRHIIIFGERGVGKTSLAKVLVDIQRHDGYRTLDTATMNCDKADDFTSLWRKVFRVIPYSEVNGRTVYLDETLPTDEVFPDDIRYCLSRFKEPSLIVIDEVDQLKDEEAKNLLAATIKNLSDHSTDITLALVGIADAVDQLVTEHRSISRALVPVRMPRMSNEEILDIIDKGLKNLGMTMDDQLRHMILRLSQGFPFYTHSLALYSGLRAIDDGRTDITMNDLALGMVDTVLNSEDVRFAYHRATSSPQSNNRYEDALLACAITRGDDLGFFNAAEACKSMSIVTEKNYDVPRFKHYLTEFCEERRGQVLESIGEKRRIRYRFRDSLMPPYITLNAFGSGRLKLEDLGEAVTRTPDTSESIH